VINVPGPEKLILLFVIALIVLGPNRLPQAARTLGRVIGEVRRMSGGFQAEVRDALADPKDALTAAVGDLRDQFGGLRDDLHGLAVGDDASSSTTSAPNPTPTSTPSSQPSMTSGGQQPLPPAPDDPSLN
jgi:sec-independent protein translocase protein TatB